jgi:hypothetical protein
MRVTREFIYLSNLPLPHLEEMAKELDVAVSTGSHKWDYVQALSRQSETKLAPHRDHWAYAGKTSVTFIRIGKGDPLDPSGVEAALTAICDGANPLTEEVRPSSLTSRPTLVAAEKLGEKFCLTFGLKNPEVQYLRDFQLVTVERDEFFSVVIRPEKAIIEVRTNSPRANRFNNLWVTEFCDFLFPDGGEGGREVVHQVLGISDVELDRLRGELSASMHQYRGKGEDGGDIDTVEITKAHSCEDLSASEEASARVKGSVPYRVLLVFDHPDCPEVKLRISTRQGSLQFMRAVPESVFDRVFEVFSRVKAI